MRFYGIILSPSSYEVERKSLAVHAMSKIQFWCSDVTLEAGGIVGPLQARLYQGDAVVPEERTLKVGSDARDPGATS